MVVELVWRCPPSFLPVSGGSSSSSREPWDIARFGRTVAFFNEDLSSPGRILQAVLTAPLKVLSQLMPGGSGGSSGGQVRDLSGSSKKAAVEELRSRQRLGVQGTGTLCSHCCCVCAYALAVAQQDL